MFSIFVVSIKDSWFLVLGLLQHDMHHVMQFLENSTEKMYSDKLLIS